MRMLGLAADARRCSLPKALEVVAALRRLMAVLVESPPRTIAAVLPPHAVLFIDGACDPGERLPSVGIGACVFDKPNGVVEYFGAQVGCALVELWAERPDQQVIAQAELVPTLIALSTWRHIFKGRPLVVFIDNDSARFGLVSGYSSVASSAAIILAIWGQLARLGIACWFARVPTVCNPADGPSRLRFEDMARIRARRVEPAFEGVGGARVWATVAAHLHSETPEGRACLL